jgi:c-di-AMP phosphodiesterase-like protein
MFSKLADRRHKRQLALAYGPALAMIAVLAVIDWRIGAFFLLPAAGSLALVIREERAFRKRTAEYMETLALRVKKATQDAINGLPVGVLLYNEDRQVEWHNPFVARMFGVESAVGEPLANLLPGIKIPKDREGRQEVAIGGRHYLVRIEPEERMLYITDETELKTLQRVHEDEQPVLGNIQLDNLDEATQGMDDQARAVLLGKVTAELSEWAARYGLYLRRTASDKYVFFTNKKTLRLLEQSRFDILDEAREHTIDHKVPITLSMGVAAGSGDLVELGAMAQSSLDIALGRGGDQAAVKDGDRLTFYGGKSDALEKRTRVRARVISHALRDLIRESDNVLILGHRVPDMDAIGAAIGMMKAVRVAGKEGFIVHEGSNPSIQQLMELIDEHETLREWFVPPAEALAMVGPRTLLIVVDTHRASMTIEPRLVQACERVVVIDHHRRSEEFINDAILVYMEPYASSTCELVTELLQYFDERLRMDVLEATALLAGIVVDTNHFTVRTGSRTFEAAGFLRRSGADSGLIREMLKENLDEYLQKADIIRRAKILFGGVAVASAEPGKKVTPLLVAQTADALLEMNGITASFVLAERPDGLIGISARSLGDINVQLVMERLGGGGHLTNAAAQMEGTIGEAEERLIGILHEMEKEEGLIE